jgi:choline-glycine betaine transporter
VAAAAGLRLGVRVLSMIMMVVVIMMSVLVVVRVLVMGSGHALLLVQPTGFRGILKTLK